MLAEMEAAEGPALARRPDILQYAGFDGAVPFGFVLQGRLRPRFAGLGPGMTGNGLRIALPRGQVGPRGGGARLFISTAAQTETRPPDELHVRYHVRLSADFDFGGGGVLPGLCVGECRSGPGAQRDVVRPHWTPFGELVFQRLPDTLPKDRRWKRFLARDTWHAVELRVKLNTPGAADGIVEAWLDGDKAVSVTNLRLRDVETTHLGGVHFETAYKARERAAPGAPARDAEVTFDDIVVAAGYIGPRQTGRP
jgi:hypothetical protein